MGFFVPRLPALQFIASTALPRLPLTPAKGRAAQTAQRPSRIQRFPQRIQRFPHKFQLLLLLLLALPALALYHAVRILEACWSRSHATLPRRIAAGVVAVQIGVLAIAGAVFVHYVYFNRDDLPDLDPFVRFQPPTVGQVYDGRGEVLIELAREYRRVIEYDGLPPVVRNAILAAEDKHFFEHSGVDYTALPRVLSKTIAHSLAAPRREAEDGPQGFSVVFPQGGSTLTQQLVRGYFLQPLTLQENGNTLLLDNWRTRLLARLVGVSAANKLVRKVEEIRLSLWLEGELAGRFGSHARAKREILARYASFVYLGNGRYGFATASEYYLGRPLSSLTEDDAAEAALLAGITKSPGEYAPNAASGDKALRRRNEILALMARNGWLEPQKAERSAAQPVSTASRSRVKTEAPAAVENVFTEIKRIDPRRFSVEQLVNGRIHVHATVDNRIQRIVNEALENGLRLYEQRHPGSEGQVQGSVVVLRNDDARVLAEAGGRRVYQDRYTSYSDYNRVTESRRQPGSALKPVVYLAAFRHGTELDSPAFDEPIAVPMGSNRPPKWISNYDQKYKGVIPVRQALAESRNAATIWITKQIGIDSVLQTARELGIRSRLQPYVTTALGASEVNLLELANVYRAMASGVIAEPYVVESISDSSGGVLYQSQPKPKRLKGEGPYLAAIQEGLRGVVRLPSGTAHALDGEAFPIPVMGKTGTTSDFRDALFIGCTYGTEGITVAVRIGYDDNRELGDKETGGRAALPIFKEIMLRAYAENLLGPPPRFPQTIEERIDQYLVGQAESLLARSEPGDDPGAPALMPAAVVTLPVRVLDLPRREPAAPVAFGAAPGSPAAGRKRRATEDTTPKI